MEILAVILARAGSKGLPDKCVRPLRGRAVIEHTFAHARAARSLSGIVLTTDSEEALRLARDAGIETIERPMILATDLARVDDVVRHATEVWETRNAKRAAIVVILYGNVPVRSRGVIDRAVAQLISTRGSSVRTVAPIGKHHPDWLLQLAENDRLTPLRANSIHRRQDLAPLWYHDGAVVAVTRESLFEAAALRPDDPHAFFGDDRCGLACEATDAVDVDDAIDLALADAVLRSRQTSNGSFCIASREISAAARPYVIAEAGVNHDGSVEKALALVDAAAKAGADAVKFQIFTARRLASTSAPLAEYQRGAASDAASQIDMLAQLELSDDDFSRVRERCTSAGVQFLATPFSQFDLQRLLKLGVPAIKLASTDLNNRPLIRAAAESRLPLLLSVGASTAREIDAAVDWLDEFGARGRTTLLACVSRYPTPLEHAGLAAIRALNERYSLPLGYSDHTQSTLTGGWAVAAGARVLEKHFTLDPTARGPDHAMSLTPDELHTYVENARQAHAALGRGGVGMAPEEEEVRRIARKSLVAARDILAGTPLCSADVEIKRPAGGLAPERFDDVLGRVAVRPIAADTPLTWDLLR
jgi:N,N'-diacetyllegionaminate synthase